MNSRLVLARLLNEGKLEGKEKADAEANLHVVAMAKSLVKAAQPEVKPKAKGSRRLKGGTNA